MIEFSKDSPDTVEKARQLIKDNESQIELFLRYYVQDVGMMIQVFEAGVCQFIGNGLQAEKFDDLLYKARKDMLVGARMNDSDFDVYNAAVLAAPSFEFLARHFRALSDERPAVISPDVIPDREIVRAALTLFHNNHRQKVYPPEPTAPVERAEAKLLGEEGDWGVEPPPIPWEITPDVRLRAAKISAELDQRKGLDPRA